MRGGYNHVKRQLQTETSQHDNSNITVTINAIEWKFEDQPKTPFALRGWSPLIKRSDEKRNRK